MRVVVPSQALAAVVAWTQRILFAAGILSIAYCGYVWMDARLFQDRELRKFEQSLAQRIPAAPNSMPVTAAGLIGRIRIPRLGVSVMVMEGTGESTLQRAVGHIPGTSLPGERGNVGLSGHRDTFFRPLRNIRRHDLITIATLAGEYSYRVLSTKIVSPSDVSVLDAGEHETLTLVTCYPFYFVGSAPERFIVRAERVGQSL